MYTPPVRLASIGLASHKKHLCKTIGAFWQTVEKKQFILHPFLKLVAFVGVNQYSFTLQIICKNNISYIWGLGYDIYKCACVFIISVLGSIELQIYIVVGLLSVFMQMRVYFMEHRWISKIIDIFQCVLDILNRLNYRRCSMTNWCQFCCTIL